MGPRESYGPMPEAAEPSLVEYISILKKHLPLMLTCGALGFLVAAIYCFVTPSLYTATTTLEIRGYAPVLANVQSETLFGNDTRKIEYAKTTVAKLNLEGLADEVLSKNTLAGAILAYFDNRKSWFNKVMRWIRDPAETNSAPSMINTDDSHFFHKPNIIRKYLELITINPIHETNLVEVVVTTADPRLSQRIANAHATGFIDHLQHERQESMETNLQLLQRQSTDLKAKVSEADGALADYADKNQLVNLSEQDGNSVIVRQIEGLAGLLAEATSKRVRSESLLNEVQSKTYEESSVLDDDTTRQLRITLKQAEVDYASLGQKVMPAFPGMMELRTKIDMVKRSLTEERRRIVRGLQSQVEADRTTELKLRQQIDSEKLNAQDMAKRLIQYNVLLKEAASLRDLYQSVLKQVKEIEISAASTTSNVFVSDYASYPNSPSAPKTNVIMTLFTLLGLGVGLVIAFLMESFDQTLKSSEDVQGALDFPLLGAVPQFSRAQTGDTSKTTKRLRILPWKTEPPPLLASGVGAPPPAMPPGKGEPAPLSKRIVTVSDPADAVSEALRTIRAGILLSSADRPPRVVMITSSMQGEGKTTILSNLAVTLAQASHRTLMIDGDLRRSQLSQLFRDESAPHSRGLSDLLTGQAGLDQVIHDTTVKGLDILPAGSKAPNPAELLGSHSMRQLIQDLSRRYDFILLDSPPVLPVADALMLSRLVDSVLMVVRSRKTDRKLAQEARRRLIHVNARVLGVILNDLDSKNADEYDMMMYGGYVETRKSGNS